MIMDIKVDFYTKVKNKYSALEGHAFMEFALKPPNIFSYQKVFKAGC